MISTIKTGVNLYKKANNIHLARREDYPKIIENIFGIRISTRELDRMTANQLMDMLVKEGG